MALAWREPAVAIIGVRDMKDFERIARALADCLKTRWHFPDLVRKGVWRTLVSVSLASTGNQNYYVTRSFHSISSI